MVSKSHKQKGRFRRGRRRTIELRWIIALSTGIIVFSCFHVASWLWLVASEAEDAISEVAVKSMGKLSKSGSKLPWYEKANKRLDKLETQVQTKLKAKSVSACRRYRKDGETVVVDDLCRDSSELVVANPAPYERIFCGQKIPGKSVRTIDKPCQEAARVHEVDATVDGTNMPPIRILLNTMFDGDVMFPADMEYARPEIKKFECDIPCERTEGGEDVITGYTIEGTDWTIMHSMEAESYYPILHIDDYAYRENHYFATTSFRSDIPLPYFSWAEYNIAQPAVSYDNVIHSASFLARNCESMNEREKVVKELMTNTRVDSLSDCLRNAAPPNGLDLSDKEALMKSYLFYLAFENSNLDDHITEKLWGSFESGTLPVYFGAPNVNDLVPPHSIISRHDFDSNKDLALYMEKVASDKKLYESYHEWRYKPLAESFVRKFNFTHTHSMCRMCRWAYAKKYGLGWDHASQTVQDLAVSRKVEFGPDGKMTHPFRESWRDAATDLDTPGGEVSVGWNRNVWEHDGVIDVHFEAKTKLKRVYRMETAIRGSFRQLDPNEFVLQDERSRLTLLTSWDAVVKNPQLGTIDVVLDVVGSSRMRVIIEDVDLFHKDAEHEKYHFGKFMTRDFFAPMEVFMVEGADLSVN